MDGKLKAEQFERDLLARAIVRRGHATIYSIRREMEDRLRRGIKTDTLMLDTEAAACVGVEARAARHDDAEQYALLRSALRDATVGVYGGRLFNLPIRRAWSEQPLALA